MPAEKQKPEAAPAAAQSKLARVKVLAPNTRLRRTVSQGDFFYGRGAVVESIPLADAEFKAAQGLIEILEVSEG